jgi:hypothetical protein
MVRSVALVSILDFALSASMPADCCAGKCCVAGQKDQGCLCKGSAPDEASCPSCVVGSLRDQYLDYLKKHNPDPANLKDKDLEKLADDFAKDCGNGDYKTARDDLKKQGVPDALANAFMDQIGVADKAHKFAMDADPNSGASPAQLSYDEAQYKASLQTYENDLAAASGANLINATDYADRLKTMNDLSQQMDQINQWANVYNQSSMPWSPDPSGGWYVPGAGTSGGSWMPGPGTGPAPSDGMWYPWIPGPGPDGGGLNLSGGPILIVNDPDLSAGITTQLGPDVVAIGTGGQGEFTVQTGSPTDLGYPPIISNVPPLPEAGAAAATQYSGHALVINPTTTGATISFLIDQTQYSLPAGQALPLSGQASWVISFDRSSGLGTASYTLAPGHYDFTESGGGWDLVQKTYKVVLDNSANPNDFSFVMEGQPGSVPAHQAVEISSKVPVVLTFDPGNGAEPANKELVEGSFTIGINPQTGLLDVFSNPTSTPEPASTSAPTSPPVLP